MSRVAVPTKHGFIGLMGDYLVDKMICWYIFIWHAQNFIKVVYNQLLIRYGLVARIHRSHCKCRCGRGSIPRDGIFADLANVDVLLLRDWRCRIFFRGRTWQVYPEHHHTDIVSHEDLFLRPRKRLCGFDSPTNSSLLEYLVVTLFEWLKVFTRCQR